MNIPLTKKEKTKEFKRQERVEIKLQKFDADAEKAFQRELTKRQYWIDYINETYL